METLAETPLLIKKKLREKTQKFIHMYTSCIYERYPEKTSNSPDGFSILSWRICLKSRNNIYIQ